MHGHCMVSMQDKENRSLATWVSNQRTQYRNRMENKKASINQQRIELLNEICFKWNVHDQSKKNKDNKENIHVSVDNKTRGYSQEGKNKINWIKMFKRLCQYKETYGHTNVLKKHDEQLKNWVSSPIILLFIISRYVILNFSKRSSSALSWAIRCSINANHTNILWKGNLLE